MNDIDLAARLSREYIKLEDHDHVGWVNSYAFSQDSSKIVSCCEAKEIKIWCTTTGECVKILTGHTNYVNYCCYSHDGRFIASSSEDRTIRIWDTISGKCIKTLRSHSKPIYYCRFSTDGSEIVSVSSDGIKIWDVISGKCTKTLVSNGYSVISPDAKKIVSKSNGFVNILEISTGLIVKINASTMVCNFSPNGSLIVIGYQEGTIEIFCTETGKSIKILERLDNRPIGYCNFSSDSSQIISCSTTGSGVGDWHLKIFDATSGKCIKILTEPYFLNSCEFSPDGSQIASCHGVYIKIWNFPLGIR